MSTAQNVAPASAFVAYLRSLSEGQFWGTVTLKFQHGNIVHITREESIQPDQLIPEYRSDHRDLERK